MKVSRLSFRDLASLIPPPLFVGNNPSAICRSELYLTQVCGYREEKRMIKRALSPFLFFDASHDSPPSS